MEKPLVHTESGVEHSTRSFSTLQVISAWLLLILGYALCRMVPIKYYPFGMFLWTHTMLALTIPYLYLSGNKLKGRDWGYPCLTALLSVMYLVTDQSAICFWGFFLSSCGYLVWLLRIYHNAPDAGGEDYMFFTLVKAVFVMPFVRLFSVFHAWFCPHTVNGRKPWKTVLWILLGLVIAVIPVCIVIALLSYDESFRGMFAWVSRIDIGEALWTRLIALLLAVPVAMVLFGSLLANREQAVPGMSEDGCKRFLGRIRFAPRAVMAAVITPLILLYLIFFVSQMPYYISAFSGVLPDGYSYAAYARKGFFELCGVCGVNAAILFCCSAFVKRRDGKDSVAAWFSAALALCSVLLAVTALSKMLLYIKEYGLTPLRVYTAWFILLLACCFILVIIRSIHRIKLARAIVIACTAFFFLLALSNPSRLIAHYNVNAYLDGRLESVDLDAMQELGDAAVPEVYRLWQSTDPDESLHRAADGWLDEMSRTEPAQSNPILSFTFPSYQADQVLDEWALSRDVAHGVPTK